MKLFSQSPRGTRASNERTRELMRRGVAHAKAGEHEQATRYFERALRSDPDPRQAADAYYWLAKMSSEPGEVRSYLEQVLMAEPSHFAARRDLAILDGRLDEQEVIDPTSSPEAPVDSHRAVVGRRFLCPSCGGRMRYQPGLEKLECEYCGEQRHLTQALAEGLQVSEDDFIHVLATALGHTSPQTTPTFACSACGASYLLAAATLSVTCANCGSSYAIEARGSQPMIPPEGIIPFRIKLSEARVAARNWLTEIDLVNSAILSGLTGVYLPVWTFDVSGELPWQYSEYDGENWVVQTGTELLVHDDYPVLASRSLPASLLNEALNFDYQRMVPFDARYLADWPAETYSIAASRAALLARWQILEAARSKVNRQAPITASDLQVSSPQLLVASYRLVLVPVWRATYHLGAARYDLLVNGQLGSVRGARPARRRGGLWGWLFGRR